MLNTNQTDTMPPRPRSSSGRRQDQPGVVTRAIALDALCHVLGRRMHADAVLDKLFGNHPSLRPLDRAFVYEIVYGSLRWLSKMDWILGHMMDRSFHSLDPRVAAALRIGTYQIFYMTRVPARAAVAETVEALKRVGAGNATGFVNAILRRVARKADYFPKPDKETETVAYYAMHTAHPTWMIERWLLQMPPERLEHALNAHNRVPLKTIRIMRKSHADLQETLATNLLRNEGIRSETRPLPTALRLEKYPDFANCPTFQSGGFIVQDEASQLAASLVRARPGQRVFDACAAPGGKTLAIWDNSPDGVKFFLSESSKKRITELRENLNRFGLLDSSSPLSLENKDACEAFEGQKFDIVVLDAPCSSLGVIGRNPEIKWLRTPSDIRSCATEQKRLLESLSQRIEAEGELVYMVCSFEPEETTDQIRCFLDAHPEFSAVDLRSRIHDYYQKYVTTDGQLLMISGNVDETDGFFAAILKKAKS